tara:strand:- start:108421 stop:109770 length:1350 start_codon:yes stop_codon:yes gene_type:complete
MLNKGRVFDLHWRISALFVIFAVLLTIGVVGQAIFSQLLINHALWGQILESTTNHHIANSTGANSALLPTQGPYRGWHLKNDAPLPADMPAFLSKLPNGSYSEDDLDDYEGYDGSSHYAAFVTQTSDGRVISVIDMTGIENLQDSVAIASILFVLVNLLLVGATIFWLYRSLRKPARHLAQKMEALDPEQPSQRLSVEYPQGELHDIAVQANLHLERVERFIERERSLLDQASHEFRTPIAVISGAVDVLTKQALPEQAHSPLERIRGTVESLTETMSALLYLSREPDSNPKVEHSPVDVILQQLIQDHEHLLAFKSAQFVLAECVSLSVNAPEAMVRIVIANLLRNAAENSQKGDVTISLTPKGLRVIDAGVGFDSEEVLRSYREALKSSMKPGGGRGLGWFLTKRICERYKWSLSISSSADKGAVVEIAFNGGEEFSMRPISNVHML